jgi:hypothetical protein
MPEGHLPVRSYLAVPVTSREGEVIGGLFYAHPSQASSPKKTKALLLGLAGQAAVAIDNARLFEAAQRANQSLEQRVLERTRELEIANEALRQSQKMEAIGQLTGGIAHDFNNLLTVIRGSADILRREGLSEDKRRRYIDAISDTADRAARLTGQLLAFARRQALRPEIFDAGAQITSITDMLRSVLGSRIELEINADCPDCFVEADIAQFETAIVNMAVNARDAMDGEGKLISPYTGRPRRITDYVCVEVSDYRSRHRPEQDRPHLRALLHDQGGRQGHRLGPEPGLWLHEAVRWRDQGGEHCRQRHDLPPSLAARDRGAEGSVSRAEPEEAVSGGRVLVVEDNAQVRSFRRGPAPRTWLRGRRCLVCRRGIGEARRRQPSTT